MKKMMWSRLKNMKCPSCGKPVVREMLTNGYKCAKCDFFISMERFNTLVQDLYQGKNVDNYQDNQEQLNNL